jgi:hypothetical protein
MLKGIIIARITLPLSLTRVLRGIIIIIPLPAMVIAMAVLVEEREREEEEGSSLPFSTFASKQLLSFTLSLVEGAAAMLVK